MLKIILAVVALLVFFTLLGIGACAFMAYRIKQNVNQVEKQAQAVLPRPAGTREVRVQPPTPPANPVAPPTTPIDFAVPAYPGGATDGAVQQMPMGTGVVQVQRYTTDDSVDKVVSFYKEKFGPKAMVQQSSSQAVVQLAGTNGVITVTITQDAGSGKTKINIASIK
jgi:hypothetical protein